MVMKDNCSNCIHWKRLTKKIGNCKIRYYVVKDKKGEGKTTYATTERTDTCEEFGAKNEV